jgi:hypothetical protein
MTESLRDDTGWFAGFQPKGRLGVSEVMETDSSAQLANEVKIRRQRQTAVQVGPDATQHRAEGERRGDPGRHHRRHNHHHQRGLVSLLIRTYVPLSAGLWNLGWGLRSAHW